MQRADVTARVWAAALALREGSAPGPAPDWTAEEQAAWALYAPIAARPEGTGLFAQVGQSLDGRIATPSGDATEVSGAGGLRHLHRCRALADAVVVGVRTALQDDPRLTVRLVPGPSPARVVIDPRGRLPDGAKALLDASVRRVVIQACERRRAPGVEVVRLPAPDGWIAPHDIAVALGDLGFGRVLVEGGCVTIQRFLDAGLLSRLHVAVAPLIIGDGPSGLRMAPVARLRDALRPETHVYGLDTDVVFDCALAAGGVAKRSTWPTEANTVAARA
ncbi:MAG: RibD family protein [Amaricoccus sp.]|uniref:RibD family protein n=1 Tax=Amaricoccus sp. TaxID=1872485 RepID=UPI0039E36C47